MLERMSTANADLVIVGHTHWPMNRMIGDVHMVNLGSIGNQYGPDLRTRPFVFGHRTVCHFDGYTASSL